MAFFDLGDEVGHQLFNGREVVIPLNPVKVAVIALAALIVVVALEHIGASGGRDSGGIVDAQANAEGASSGTFTDNGDGTYTYTFAQALTAYP